MSTQTKIFLSTMFAAGAGAVWCAMASWTCADPLRFATYLAVSLLAAPVKVALPGARGVTTGGFLVLMCALVELSASEAVIVGVVSAIFQTYWRPATKPKLVHAAFNASNIAFARMSAGSSFATLMASDSVTFPAAVMIAAMIYFVVSTIPLAMVVGLTEGGSPFERWRKSESWLAIHYLAAASMAMVVHYGSQHYGWPVITLVLPLVFLYGKACHARLDKPERLPSMQLAPPRIREGASSILRF